MIATMLRYYYFILGPVALVSKVGGFFKGTPILLTVFWLIVFLMDLYYLWMSHFLFQSGTMILELDLIYRDKQDTEVYGVN
jgi:hypothetical protein